MRVFVAGASGVVGRPLVRQLLQAGHSVTGTTRRPEAADRIRADGAHAAVVGVFDREALSRAVAAPKPEVVVNELTSYGGALDYRDQNLYERTNRVRTEGTRNLIAAARAAGARRIVAQSVAFIYVPAGEWVKDEEAPILADIPGAYGTMIEGIRDLEHQVMESRDLEGVVLRYGFFYGPGTHYSADGYYAGEFRKRRFPIVGSGRATYSFIHLDDAASATVAACERGAPGIYNVTDDEPAQVRAWAPAFAAAVGARPPRRVPKFIARLVVGKALAESATTMRGASNAKARRELDWQPLHSSWREGFRESRRSRG